MTATHYPRSPKIMVGGLAHLARMIDKVRLRHAGGIPDYTYLTGGFDKALLDYLQIDAAAFERRVLARTIHEYLLRRPILSSGEDFLVRPPRRTASTPPAASGARSPGGLRPRTPRDGIHE